MKNTLPSIEEYTTSLTNPRLIKVLELQSGHCVKSGITTVKYTGGFCVVFPFECTTRKVAVRCWHASLDGMQERIKLISEELKRAQLPYFVSFDYVKDGLCTNEGVQPIIIMDWVDGLTIKEYIGENIQNKQTLLELADKFKEMVADLHKHNLSHGDLQHGNIMVRADGSLVLVDYDSMYVPALDGYPEEITGLPGYQHEARSRNRTITPKADYFSELVIYISIIALANMPDLWKELKIEDSETLAFTAYDIQSKGSSPIFAELSRIPELKEAVEKLQEFILQSSIEDLQPLEEAIISKKKRTLDNIYAKMENRPPIEPHKKQDTSSIVGNIFNNMGNRPTVEEKSMKTMAKYLVDKM